MQIELRAWLLVGIIGKNPHVASIFSVISFAKDRLMAFQDKYITQALQERVFQKLFEAAEIAKFSPDEKNKYEESLKYYRDLKNVVDTSFDEGIAVGKAEGIAVGKAEGIAVGKAEGIAEGKAAIARQMKSEGEPVEKIIRFTGLTKDEIEKL